MKRWLLRTFLVQALIWLSVAVAIVWAYNHYLSPMFAKSMYRSYIYAKVALNCTPRFDEIMQLEWSEGGILRSTRFIPPTSPYTSTRRMETVDVVSYYDLIGAELLVDQRDHRWAKNFDFK